MDRRSFLRLASGLVVAGAAAPVVEAHRRFWPGWSAAKLPSGVSISEFEHWVDGTIADLRPVYSDLHPASRFIHTEIMVDQLVDPVLRIPLERTVRIVPDNVVFARSGGIVRAGELVQLRADGYAERATEMSNVLGIALGEPDSDGVLSIQTRGLLLVSKD